MEKHVYKNYLLIHLSGSWLFFSVSIFSVSDWKYIYIIVNLLCSTGSVYLLLKGENI